MEVGLPADCINSSTGWQCVAGGVGVAVPWHVSHLRVVPVCVAVGTGVTVAVVAVAVSTGVAVDLDGRVNSKREHTVLRHQPLGFHCGRNDNLWAVDLDEESRRVWFRRAFFQHSRDWDLCKEFTGFDVSDFEGFLGLRHFFAEHVVAEEESETGWNLDGF